MIAPFRNEPLTDFCDPVQADRMRAALAQVASALGREYPAILDGRPVTTKAKIRSTNPAVPAQCVGVAQALGVADARRAVTAAATAFGDETGSGGWRHVPWTDRAAYVLQAAEVLRRRKHELAAWMVYEVGKNWAEADADVAEAIDFCAFYGREALRYGAPQSVTSVAGERNQLLYIPLGVGVILPPWNFPLAILVGMTTAAIVCGNTVVLKPSSEAPVIAAKFMEVMAEVGLPPGVINCVTGSGGTIGDTLVDHPFTRFVSFTGSKETGLRIIARAARVQPGQKWIKRVVAEMGGKDAIVIDDETDLGIAVEGVVQAAYGYQGQKCSACSRAIVVDAIYELFVQQLKARVERVRVGPATEPGTDMGPVVSERQFQTVLHYIAIGKTEGRLIVGGRATSHVSHVTSHGFFIEPTVFIDVPAKARIAQEEIFGPVLAVIKAKNFDDAIAIANDTEYGLTGAVYSNNPEKLAHAKAAFHVGNLYLNRKCTGALVGGHPFGGFNMSGTDSKAGGPDYLFHFVQAKTVAERA